MKYFAHGSNMSLLRLKERVPSAKKLGIVTLKSHQLRFNTHEIYSQQALGQPLTASITGGTKNEYLYT